MVYWKACAFKVVGKCRSLFQVNPYTGLLLTAGLSLSALSAYGANSISLEQADVTGTVEPESICDPKHVPTKYDPATTQFIFDISCDEASRTYSIRASGGKLSYQEKTAGKVDESRCRVMKEGDAYGVTINGEYRGQERIEHFCDVGDGYQVRTVIDYTKSWAFTQSCPVMVGAISMLFERLGLKEFHKRVFQPDKTYVLPYSTDLELMHNGKAVFAYDTIQGFGFLSADEIQIDGKKQTFQNCKRRIRELGWCGPVIGFDELKKLNRLHKSYGLGCSQT